MIHMSGAYYHYWIVFSILIGILFSYIALDLRWKMIVFKDFMYKLWLLGCAVAMGIGIWTMHFVGMAAMRMHTPIIYDVRLVFLSFIVSIISTGIAFFIMNSNKYRLLCSSILMGGGIAGMHYIGINALKVNSTLMFNPSIVVLSIIIAVISAYGSLWLLFYFNHSHPIDIRWRIISSILMGVGISGMHYVGMWGTDLQSTHATLDLNSPYYITSDALGSFITIPSIIVVFILLLSGAFLDRKLISNTKELKESEKKLRESEKLSLVGELAAGVAHEIRNPLTSLKGFTKLLYESPDGKMNKEYLKIMMDELNRINFIVSEFMVLSKPHLVNFSTKNLSSIIQNVVAFLNMQAIMKNIEIIPVIIGNSFSLKCEENQIKQVLMNIIKNSIEAMPHGGKIYVKLENNASFLIISVIDHGVGIPPENQPLLGKPFFTTKTEGTGLGLMVSRKIIQNHHGKFNIESDPKKGTTVTIALPINGIHKPEQLVTDNHSINESM